MARPQNDFSTEAFSDAGEALARLDRAMTGYTEAEVEPLGLSIRRPQARGGEYMVTLRGVDTEGNRLVAFHTAFTLTELFRGLWNRYQSGNLKWREDQYAR